MIIAIDGPAGSGKSTTAKLIAKKLNILHLDTGAMYRCITLKGLQNNIPFTDEINLGKACAKTDISFKVTPQGQQVFMDGVDVTQEIRTREVTANVSDYCAVGIVRQILVDQQRRIGRSTDTILEGRDIGTVVFPDADFKFYLVADVKERAIRRQLELKEKGTNVSIEDLIKDINERDTKDSTRENSPLKKATDAIEIDTTHLSIEEQVDLIVKKVRYK